MYKLSDIDNEFDDIFRNLKEPQWMHEIRKEAFQSYNKLPFEVSQLYTKYSNANHLIPERVYLEKENIDEEMEEFNERLNDLNSGPSILCKNSKVIKTFLPEDLSKQGVIISDISEAINNFPDLLYNFLIKNKLDVKEDRYLALSLAAFHNGFFVYIPREVILEEPIKIVNHLSKNGFSSIARNIVISEPYSKCTIVQELYSPKIKNEAFQQSYFELFESYVMSNSQLEIITLQSLDYNAVNFSNRKAFVHNDSRMSWSLGLFGTKLSRYKIDSIMKGQGSSVEDMEIIFGIDNQSFDITSNLIHSAPNTKGRVIVKSVMKDKAQSLFKGMIKINKNAKSTESFLAGHAILLDKGAKSDAIPGLEIESNEVKATHSASVSQIDEKQIFYLMSRGLSQELAKREIVGGFLEPISRKMDPIIRSWISYLIDNKWSGKPLILKTDEALTQILEVEKTRYREAEDIFEKHYKYR